MLDTGTVLQNRYRIAALLGQGGMGAVYRAWHLTLKMPVAIKEMVPQPGLDAATLSQLRQQFQQEAAVLARLSHPNLVRVIDHFEEGGSVYLVMDFVEGESLADRIAREGALTESEVLAWADQLLDALDYCHDQGVIHRDIKPQNVIVRPDGRAVLVDFGLVKLWDPSDPHTRTVMRGMGTPEYAPPEQYSSQSGHTGPHSDVYSLGATLYHALTGRVPMTANDRMVALTPFPSVGELNPQVSDETGAAISRAMELPVPERFANAAQMQAALGNRVSALSQAPAVAPLVPQPAQAQSAFTAPSAPMSPPVPRRHATEVMPRDGAEILPWWKRVPGWVWAVGGVVAIALCAGLGLGVFSLGQTIMQFINATAEPLAVERPTRLPTQLPTQPPAAVPKTLVVCQGQEPDTMYVHGGSMLAAAHIQTAIYDSAVLPYGVDNAGFAYQATITKKLPSLDDGDAVIQIVSVQAGDMVVDDSGRPSELRKGLLIRPAGCRSSDCVIEYNGSGEVEMDQMVVVFGLSEGLTWADGTPVKASDSVYSFNLYMDPDTPAPTRYTGERTTSYEAVDDQTLVWTGLPGLLDSTYFANIWIPLPEHVLGEMSAADIAESEEASRLPMGFGAFTVKEWKSGDHITVVKNERYFRADEGLPKVDEIVFRFIGEDPNVAVAALLAGECDIVTQDTHTDEMVDLLLEREEAGDLDTYIVTGDVWEHIDFGINPVDEYAATRPDFFEDVRVRQAIAMCIDRQALVDDLLYGRSEVLHTYLPSNHPLFNGSVRQYPYDPEAAMELLDDAGWRDLDGDGYRECAGCDVEGAEDGDPLAFKWSSTTATLRQNVMQIGQANLRECGIDVTLENLAASEWFANGPEGPLFGRHFDLGGFAWLTFVEPPCDLYLTEQWPTEDNGWAGQNDPGYTNPAYDAACNAALQALPGTSEYESNHLKAQEIFAEDLPVVPLFVRLKIAAARPQVSGFKMDPTCDTEMFNIEHFDLEETQ
jgi:peptide/nickel transport system substrate-binding protein